MGCGASKESTPRGPKATAGPEMQSALVFVKPHANTPAVNDLVKSKFAEQGINIVTDGVIDGPTIDSKKLIDQHYYAIASKATILKPSELAVPADKFKDKFGEEWATVLAEGRVYNALDAAAKLEVDVAELDRIWKAATPADKVVKFGGGFYCALLEPEGKDPIYTFNAFFMFTAPEAAIHYYVVEFDSMKLKWSDFRGKVLGPTDPAKAPAGSLRGLLNADWEKLGLPAAPNVTDNGVHASASPFEGLAERMNWLERPLTKDTFGKQLVALGITEETLKAWSVDPRVKMPDGSEGSLFDALEDLDVNACLARALAINKVGKTMQRKPIVGGNWKCNPAETEKLAGLIENVNKCDTSKCELYVCPSMLHVPLVNGKFTNGASVCTQNCNFKGTGAFTGEAAVEQMKDMGISWMLLGHSERRELFKEDDELLATKLAYVLEKGMNCVFCIGEKKEEREAGTTMEVCKKQLEQVKDMLDPARVVIAYEPVWAIGTGLTATPEMAQETHKQIRDWVKDNVSAEVAEQIRIQYGGSANAKNAPDLSKQPDIDGFLVGGASLKPEFADIVKAISEAKV